MSVLEHHYNLVAMRAQILLQAMDSLEITYNGLDSLRHEYRYNKVEGVLAAIQRHQEAITNKKKQIKEYRDKLDTALKDLDNAIIDDMGEGK